MTRYVWYCPLCDCLLVNVYLFGHEGAIYLGEL